MYEDYPQTYKTPNSHYKPIWRYMDFWKFLNLLETSSLYFSNAENLGDNNEGKFPKEVFEMMRQKDLEFYTFLKNELDNKLSKETLISSWTYHENESFAMWKMYAKDKMGIAIKTDLESLKKAFNKTDRIVHIGEITYFNKEQFNYNFTNLNYAFLNKHEYYNFEKEIRCITSCLPDEEVGCKLIEVNLDELLKTIYISPNAKSEYKKLLEMLKLQYNLNFNIELSEVNDSWL
jgi:hypothetical protein